MSKLPDVRTAWALKQAELKNKSALAKPAPDRYVPMSERTPEQGSPYELINHNYRPDDEMEGIGPGTPPPGAVKVK